MKKDCLIFKILFVFLIFSNISYSQNPNIWFSETEIEFEWETENRFDHAVELATRALLTERLDGEKISGYQQQHVEFTYFSIYKASETTDLSLGVRYRFSEIFVEDEYNELRIIPQYSFSYPNSQLNLYHEARVEQRITKTEYVLRPRVETGIEKPLSRIFSLEASTESLWSISPQNKPEFEQRFALEFENYSFKNIELVFGFEYRMEDFTHDLEHEFFILSGANIAL